MRFQRWLTSVLLAVLLVSTGEDTVTAGGLVLPVPVKVVYPGEIIDDSMITERPVGASGTGRLYVVSEKSELIGKVARRTLLPGRPVLASTVKIPDLISRGARVTVIFSDGGLMIHAQAMALEAGSAGDRIRIRNTDSGVTINGTVQADGTIRVGVY